KKIIPVSIHQGDWLEIPSFYNDIKNHLGGISGFPRAAINRIPAIKGSQIDSVVYSIYNWRVNIMEILKNEKTSVGLAISSNEINNKLEIKIFACNQDTLYKNARLSIYLVEDSIKSVSQMNADSNYLHQQVLKKVITENFGDTITLAKGEIVERIYTTNIREDYFNKKKLKIIAFLHIIGNDSKQHRVLNAQSVGLNATQQWD
ncbi:MAG TPA: Omp28-related outer membrane protein, partial [Chitinophagaceae bacterium]|nr:Omp28-related outer membrane protein [Chitinophagaceae bacterium]